MTEAKRLEHRIDFAAGRALIDPPCVVNVGPGEPQPEGTIRGDEYGPWAASLTKRVKPTRRRLDIMSALVTGSLPWGVKNFFVTRSVPSLPLCGREYILCCGHVLTEKLAQEFVNAGLLTEGPRDKFDRPTLMATRTGEVWLSAGWR